MMDEQNRKRAAMRMYMPIIFKLGKLHIRHDNPMGNKQWRKVINVYWDEKHILSITPYCLNLAIFKKVFYFRKDMD